MADFLNGLIKSHCTARSNYPFCCWDHNNYEIGSYHCCWCLGSLHCQVISSHGIEYKDKLSPCLPWGSISCTCAILVSRNDKKWDIFMFLKRQSACGGLSFIPFFPFPVTHSSQQRPADGLTVGQLTMLGRVHAARVVIENLELSDRLDKSKSHGKPPRPTKKSW